MTVLISRNSNNKQQIGEILKGFTVLLVSTMSTKRDINVGVHTFSRDATRNIFESVEFNTPITLLTAITLPHKRQLSLCFLIYDAFNT